MADHRAVAAVCEAVIQRLSGTYRREYLGNDLDFRVYAAQEFSSPTNLIETGVSLFLYRLDVEGTFRNPMAVQANGRKHALLPLELHFLLTAWGGDASMQNAIAAWMMRAMEDMATLTAGQLNGVRPDAFRPNEGVDLFWEALSNEDLTQIWDSFIHVPYRLSVPYTARVVNIESYLTETGAGPVVEREHRIGQRVEEA